MTDPASPPRVPGIDPYDRSFFGHPRGLSTLFFTEMWERFSYYGMRALLILFMTAPLASGGLGFDTASAGAVYGLYVSMVYLMTLPGGVGFLAASVGNFIAGRLSGFYEAMPLPTLVGTVALFAIVAGLVMFALVPWMRRLMGEVN
jgi:dipeptide/tripeptide permease